MKSRLQFVISVFVLLCAVAPEQGRADPSMLFHYPLDGTTKNTVNGQFAAVFGRLGYGPGRLDQAAILDGDTHLREHQVQLDLSDFTLSAWIQRGTWPDWYEVAVALHSGRTGHINFGSKSIMLFINSNGMSGLINSIDGGQGDSVSYRPNMPHPGWTHYAFVRRGNTLEMWVNGRREATSISRQGVFSLSRGQLELGAPNYWGAMGGWAENGRDTAKLRGRLDDVRLYGRALSINEIKEHAEGRIQPPDPVSLPQAQPRQAPATAAPLLPRVASPLWIENSDGTRLRVGLTLAGSQPRYVISDEADVPITDQRPKAALLAFAWAYEMAQSAYLKPSKRDDLFALKAAFRLASLSNRSIRALARFQEEVASLGVVGISAYLSGGAILLKEAPELLLDEVARLVKTQPTLVVQETAQAHLAAADLMIDDLVWYTGQRQASRGISPQTAILMSDIQRLYTKSIFVDCFALPSAELLLTVQPASDLAGSLRRLGVSAAEETAEQVLSSFTTNIVSNLIMAGDFVEGMSIANAAFDTFWRDAQICLDKWQTSRPGLGGSQDTAPMAENFRLWEP